MPTILRPDGSPWLSEVLLDGPQQAWWCGLTEAEREAWADRMGRVADVGRGPEPRPERIIRQMAWTALQNSEAVPRNSK